MTLITKVVQWGAEKGILENSSPNRQYLKTVEELGELASAIGRQDVPEIKDAIGDVAVTVILYGTLVGQFTDAILHTDKTIVDKDNVAVEAMILVGAMPSIKSHQWEDYFTSVMNWLDAVAQVYDSSLQECLQLAYDVISKRTGTMVNGLFVKDTEQ